MRRFGAGGALLAFIPNLIRSKDSSISRMESLAEIESKVKRLLVSRLDVRPEALEKVDSATPLLGRGIGLDSVEALTLASEIEGEFDIHFEDKELTPDLFRSLGALATSIAAKCQDRTGSRHL
jgi:acyl carrier protein